MKLDPTLAYLVDRLTMSLALLQTVVEEGLTEDHKATIELFLADTSHGFKNSKELYK